MKIPIEPWSDSIGIRSDPIVGIILLGRNNYTYYWEFDSQLCPYIPTKTTNFNSVKHIHIRGTQAANNNNNNHYFPNVIELTIEEDFEIFDGILTDLLNNIFPLNKITRLNVKNFHLDFEQLLAILMYNIL